MHFLITIKVSLLFSPDTFTHPGTGLCAEQDLIPILTLTSLQYYMSKC